MTGKQNNKKTNDTGITIEVKDKQKRGRKSKQELLNILSSKTNTIVNIEKVTSPITTADVVFDIKENIQNIENIETTIISEQKPITKKRGRKPKGGKIITNNGNVDIIKSENINIILHLKCSMKDLMLKNDSYLIFPNEQKYSDNNVNIVGQVNIIDSGNYYQNNFQDIKPSINECQEINNLNGYFEQYDDDDEDDECDNASSNNQSKTKDMILWKKLKELENNLHYDNIPNKRCACFHDTCPFDNPPIYIPKYIKNGVISVYGCFCSPECACGFLMNEHIDSSTKYERYFLLNFIYGKIYKYKKHIKPSPSPYYLLDKFYGNISIQSYRSLLSNDRLFLFIDKPITKIFPELHEDNDEFLLNKKKIPENTNSSSELLKFVNKKQSKTNILNEKFGVSSNT
jgi:hypothetical protein